MTDRTRRTARPDGVVARLLDRRTPEGLDSTLGMRLVSATEDEVVIALPITERLRQPTGIVHGGTYCALVESAASIGGQIWAAPRAHVVGVSNHTSFLAAAQDGELRATAVPVHRGRTLQVWQVEIVDDTGTLLATGQMHLANLVSGPVGSAASE